jgi:hypothetical protein
LENSQRKPFRFWHSGLFTLGFTLVTAYVLFASGRDMMAAKSLIILLLVAGGALVGHMMSRVTMRFYLPHRQLLRTIYAIACLSIWVILVIAGLFWLQYLVQFLPQHATVFSKLWLAQQFYTAATSLAVFAVIGLRILIPLPALILILDGIIFARPRN